MFVEIPPCYVYSVVSVSRDGKKIIGNFPSQENVQQIAA